MTRPAHRLSLISFAAAAALLGSAPALAQSEPAPDLESKAETQRANSKGEEKLANLLKGREAGEPQQCIRNLLNDPIRTIDRTAYVFGRGNTIYVQRTLNPDAISDQNGISATRFNTTQLCRNDVVTSFDRANGFFMGTVPLVDFVPYTLVKSGK